MDLSNNYLFLGGMINGEARCDIKGNIFMVPYYDNIGFLQFQTYNKECLDTFKRMLGNSIRSAEQAHTKKKKQGANNPNEVKRLSDKIERDTHRLRTVERQTRDIDCSHIFLFYKDSGEKKEEG